MPPKPYFNNVVRSGYDVSYGTWPFNRYEYQSYKVISEIEFNEWYNKEIAPLFENAEEVFSNQTWQGWYPLGGPDDTPTIKALLIKIEPIKEDTAEDFLRDFIKDHEKIYGPTSGGIIDKAKAYLERKKK